MFFFVLFNGLVRWFHSAFLSLRLPLFQPFIQFGMHCNSYKKVNMSNGISTKCWPATADVCQLVCRWMREFSIEKGNWTWQAHKPRIVVCHEHVNNQIKYSLVFLAIGIDHGDHGDVGFAFYHLDVVLVLILVIEHRTFFASVKVVFLCSHIIGCISSIPGIHCI